MLEIHDTAAVICLSPEECARTGRMNPTDGVCLWPFLSPLSIECIMLVWRGENSWQHRFFYDSMMPTGRRYVSEPGSKVELYTREYLRKTIGLDAFKPEDYTAITLTQLTELEKDDWKLPLVRCPACFRATPVGSTVCWHCETPLFVRAMEFTGDQSCV